MKMIKLSKNLYINLHQITAVERSDHGTTIIHTNDGTPWEVDVNINDVIEHIHEVEAGLEEE